MKKYLLTAVACLFACSLFIGVQTASAALADLTRTDSGERQDGMPIPIWNWQTNGAKVYIGGQDPLYGFQEFGIYNPEDENTRLILRNSTIDSGELTFFQQGSDPWVANYQPYGGASPTGPLTLNEGELPIWRFYFIIGNQEDDNVTQYIYLIDPAGQESGSRFLFSNDSVNAIVSTSPIPIPTASVLLTTGLVGLLGVRRRIEPS